MPAQASLVTTSPAAVVGGQHTPQSLILSHRSQGQRHSNSIFCISTGRCSSCSSLGIAVRYAQTENNMIQHNIH